MPKTSRFKQYKKKNVDLIKKKATRFSGDSDAMYKEAFQRFSPESGTNKVRLLPANDEYWGIEVYIHWLDVDGNNRPYLCPKKMKGEDCPICDEAKKARADGDEKYEKQLRPSEKLLTWVIDRNNEEDGPKLWDIPKMVEIDINGGAVDEDTNEPLPLDDPADGYDIRFTKEGKGLNTRYHSVNIARRESPLHDDEDTAIAWLDFIEENPLEEVINVYPPEHLAAVFNGKPVSAVLDNSSEEAVPDSTDDDDAPWEEDDNDLMADAGDVEEEEEEESKSTKDPSVSKLRERMANRRGKR